ALSLREARAALDEHGGALRKAELAIEQQLAEQRRCEAELETGRERHAAATEHANAVQAEVYQVGAEIARIEQQIRHNRELAEQLERARAETERSHAELAEHIGNDRMRLQELGALLAESEPQLASLRAADEAGAEALRNAESKLAEWQAQWDAHTITTSQAAQAAEV